LIFHCVVILGLWLLIIMINWY